MLTREQVDNKELFSKISFYALLVAMIPVLPYFYYQLLKFLVCGTAAYSAYLFNQLKNKKWMWIMVIIAVIFNPISPIYFGHPVWSVIDLVVAIFFINSLKLKI